MLIFKCKMCGGSLSYVEDKTVATCDYCGTKQTVPRLNSERRANLYDRANHFRRNNEFDKAMGIYEQILAEDNTDAEAYWSRVLCRYGIEYVEDPATRRRVPTVNRTQYTSIFDDADYKSALEFGDLHQRKIFEEEAKAINEIQKGILSISQEENPFDVFICYKETDEQGRRTPDSVLAADLYHQLTQEGFKVFFSRITLEDKLGTAYEPYIFAALNSAKVMVVIGTKAEYFNAVWVKNEWSRFLALIKDGSGKALIPAYRDMDPYDLPEEFSHLQAQDMSKLGFMQDLIRGIKKITAKESQRTSARETVVTPTNSNATPLLKRAYMFLEDGDFDRADEFFEQVLNLDPEMPMAYIGKLMAELKVRHQDELADCAEPFDDNTNFQKAVRFAKDDLKATLNGYIDSIKERNEHNRLDGIYHDAKAKMEKAATEDQYMQAATIFTRIAGWRDSEVLASVCIRKADDARKNMIYSSAKAAMKGSDEQALQRAIGFFQSIPDWRDSNEKIIQCQKRIEEIRHKNEANRLAVEKTKKKIKRIALITSSIVVIIAMVVVLITFVIPNNKYKRALSLQDAGQVNEAYVLFMELGEFKDSAEKVKAIELDEIIKQLDNKYEKALSLQDSSQVNEAYVLFTELGEFKDSAEKAKTIELTNQYEKALSLQDIGQVDEAYVLFIELGEFKDSAEKAKTIELTNQYEKALSLQDSGQVNEAYVLFMDLGEFKDSAEKAEAIKRDEIDELVKKLEADDYENAVPLIASLGRKIIDLNLWIDILSLIRKHLPGNHTLSAGRYHTAGLKADGTVIAVGRNDYGQCNVKDWKDIVAISAGQEHTAGLKADGTVVAVGDNLYGQCNVGDWKDIVAISAGRFHTAGLKADGTVVAVGSNDDGERNVEYWKDIVAISAGSFHKAGLKADGTVVAVGSNIFGQRNVEGWKDIVAISAGRYNTAGLKADGTVIAVGSKTDGQRFVEYWKDIVAISAGADHIVGLKADGTVVAVGRNDYGQCNVEGWMDIVAISAGYDHTAGLKADGTVVAVGRNNSGQCNVEDWKDIMIP